MNGSAILTMYAAPRLARVSRIASDPKGWSGRRQFRSANNGTSPWINRTRLQWIIPWCGALIVIVCLLCSSGCEVRPRNDPQPVRLSRAKFYEETVRFPGRITSTIERERYSVPIINDTNAAVAIGQIVPSCGCSDVRLTPNVLAQSGTGLLEFDIAPAEFFGKRRINCALLDSTRKIAYQCAIELVSYPRLSFADPQLHFGKVDPGSSIERTIYASSYHDLGDYPIAIPVIDTDHPHIEAYLQSSHETRLDDAIVAMRYAILVRLNPRTSEHSSVCHLKIRTRRGSEVESAQLPLFWSPCTPYVAFPSRLFFSYTDASEELSDTCRISQTDGLPFTIREIRCTKSFLHAEVFQPDGIAAPKDEAVIRVVIDTGRVDNANFFSAELVLTMDSPTAFVLTVPISGLYH